MVEAVKDRRGGQGESSHETQQTNPLPKDAVSIGQGESSQETQQTNPLPKDAVSISVKDSRPMVCLLCIFFLSCMLLDLTLVSMK